MKYVVVLGDGMADLPIESIGGKTPLDVANKPNIDMLAKVSEIGLVKTVADGMKPGSDVANLSVLGYDSAIYYSGRSPLEAVSIGVDFTPNDVTYRTNLVTLKGDKLSDCIMQDYSAGEITTEEARELILAVEKELGASGVHFFPGISYRHCLLLTNTTTGADLTPPHDISGKVVGDYLPKGEHSELLISLIEKARPILENHSINKDRIKRGLNPANSIWFWGEGRKPNLKNFEEKNGVKGAMISAVDLLKGIAMVSGMEVIEVEGATGNNDTNYNGKALAALDSLKRNDFVYIHIEAADECGHRGELKNKIGSIEDIDKEVVGTLIEGLKGQDYSIMIVPDHPTPIALKTHTKEPVPYLIYRSTEIKKGVDKYNEDNAKASGVFVENGYTLIDKFLNI